LTSFIFSFVGSYKDKKINIADVYDFDIPQYLVGRLIGRHGSFLYNIRTKTNVEIYVLDHPIDPEKKMCSIHGNIDNIILALKLIRQKFPADKFLDVTLERTRLGPQGTPLSPEFQYDLPSLSLIAGVNNEISVLHIVKPNWFFVCCPTHPTHCYLRSLEEKMMVYYSNEITITNSARGK